MEDKRHLPFFLIANKTGDIPCNKVMEVERILGKKYYTVTAKLTMNVDSLFDEVVKLVKLSTKDEIKDNTVCCTVL